MQFSLFEDSPLVDDMQRTQLKISQLILPAHDKCTVVHTGLENWNLDVFKQQANVNYVVYDCLPISRL